MIGSNNLSFWDNWTFSPQLQLILLLRIKKFWFSQLSTSVWKMAKYENKSHGCWWLHEEIRVWQASRTVDFVNNFFPQKIQHKAISLGIQLILSILSLWYLKISGKSIRTYAVTTWSLTMSPFVPPKKLK